VSNLTDSTRAQESRQWMYDHLVHSQGLDALLPPTPLVEALADLGLAPFDLGWARHEHDHRSDVTTWVGLVATPSVLVEFTASAALASDKKWCGNTIEKTAVHYAQGPTIDIDLTRFDQVVNAHMTSTGASNSSSGEHPRQTWIFKFKDGTNRKFELASDDTEPADLRPLCRRIVDYL
jgi:hypothetical protein